MSTEHSVNQPNAGGPDWRAYYEGEAALHDFDAAVDRVEIHRCRAAWSVFPRKIEGTLLDVGCGNGYFCHWISQRARLNRVVGVDLSAPRVEAARQRYPDMEFVVGAANALPFPNAAFDIVTCIEVLEHLEDPGAALRELLRVARRYVVITVPDRQPVRMVLCPHCGKPFPLYGHIQTFDLKRIEALVASAGGRVEKAKGYYAPRGERWGIPTWLGAVLVRMLRRLRPGPATFLAARIVPAQPRQ